MGTIGDSGRLASFNNDVFAQGVDLDRSKIHQDGGIYKITPGEIIRPGMIVSREGSDGLIVPVDTAARAHNHFGVAKWGNEPLGVSLESDEAVTVVFGGVTQLDHSNVSNLVVRDTATDGGQTTSEEIPAASNYTLGAVNGTITWDNPTSGTNAPGNGDTVFVTYTYALTAADFQFQGVKFHSNTADDVTNSSEGRLVVVTDWAIIFTTEWDTGRTYDTTGVLSNLYADDAGKFSNNAGLSSLSARFMGKVFQLPQAGDPHMGVQITGAPTIAP